MQVLHVQPLKSPTNSTYIKTEQLSSVLVLLSLSQCPAETQWQITTA